MIIDYDYRTVVPNWGSRTTVDNSTSKAGQFKLVINIDFDT